MCKDNINSSKKQERKIKCVVWDLDNTIWDGILMEDKSVNLYENICSIVEQLDSRGILQSIASKNEYSIALEKLKELGLNEYFIYPQINWNPKSNSIKAIAEQINIGLDAIAFIDDQEYELEEVGFSAPEVLLINALHRNDLLNMPELNPRFITDDARNRRKMYLNDQIRKNEEDKFIGPQEEFLASLGMEFTIEYAKEKDLQRVEELTVRTHQLNTTGYTYSYEELHDFIESDKYKLLVASLDDKYGSYGKIGIALVECDEDNWNIKLLLMSCRVMSRGVGSIMINNISDMAQKANVVLKAEFVHTDRNRMMYITYKFAGFKELGECNGITILENNFSQTPGFPDYINIKSLA